MASIVDEARQQDLLEVVLRLPAARPGVVGGLQTAEDIPETSFCCWDAASLPMRTGGEAA
jgi:hypothetical protein